MKTAKLLARFWNTATECLLILAYSGIWLLLKQMQACVSVFCLCGQDGKWRICHNPREVSVPIPLLINTLSTLQDMRCS